MMYAIIRPSLTTTLPVRSKTWKSLKRFVLLSIQKWEAIFLSYQLRKTPATITMKSNKKKKNQRWRGILDEHCSRMYKMQLLQQWARKIPIKHTCRENLIDELKSVCASLCHGSFLPDGSLQINLNCASTKCHFFNKPSPTNCDRGSQWRRSSVIQQWSSQNDRDNDSSRAMQIWAPVIAIVHQNSLGEKQTVLLDRPSQKLQTEWQKRKRNFYSNWKTKL